MHRVFISLPLVLLVLVFLALVLLGVATLLFLLIRTLLRKSKNAAPPAPPTVPIAQAIIKYCPKCGAPMPPDSPEGLCPRCLIALNLATQTDIPGEPCATKPPPAPPAPVADVAKLFPQLEILECLGRGGMGAVYKARQPRLDRIVALKILSPEKQGNQKFAERFEREARALAKLHHPNIVTVYDFGETEGNFYLLMEFMDGLTLRQLLQARKLSPAEALAIVPKICEALQYAHEQGIVHRDIKPENILMDKEGRIKIADFGIAKILGDNGSANLTAEQVIGTPHYMSPEQIEKPQSVDHRADIYSLGVVFYEMLTGELPLGKFQPPSKKVLIDVRLDEIVLRALEKEPEHRYQHASEVKTHVETIAAGGMKPGSTNQGPETYLQMKLRLGELALGCAALSGFLGFLAFCFWPEQPGILVWSIPVAAALGIILGIRTCNTWFGKSAIFAASANIVLWVTILTIINIHAGKSDYIGGSWLPEGDSIEITSVERTKDQMTVRGRYNLVSHDKASLALNITSTNVSGFPYGSNQSIEISKGSGDFELVHPHVVPGMPHVSMYAGDHSFAALYFGNKAEAAEEAKYCDTLNAEPVALWWGDNKGKDSISGHDGVLENVGFTDGVIGRAFAFDPENYPYGTYTGVKIADDPLFELTNALSIEGWIRPRGPGYMIFWRGDQRPGLDPYYLAMNGNETLRFGIGDDENNTAYLDVPLEYGKWWHVVGTYDNGFLRVYTNGVMAAEKSTPIRPFAKLMKSASPGIGIGNLNDGGNSFPFRGDVGEIALYNRSLSLEEIQSDYKAGYEKIGSQETAVSSPLTPVEITAPHMVYDSQSQTLTASGNPVEIKFAEPRPASAETWSPTLAPGEKPNLQQIYQDAKDLMGQEKYEESLQRYLWYFNHAPEYADQGQAGVRLSFALSDWAELGRRYPKAKEALTEIRDNDTQKILNGQGYFDLLMDVHSINQYLGDDDATYALFKSIKKSDPQLASQCFAIVEGVLMQHGDYITCRKYIGDPQGSFLSISNQYQMGLQNQIHMAALDQKTKQMMGDILRQHGWTNSPPNSPPDPSALMKKSVQNLFVGQVRQLIEVLIATGSKTDAENIQKEALAVLNDPRITSAVDDAAAHVSRQSGPGENSTIINTNHPQVVSVWPPNGTADVDTQEDIHIRFDQPMNPNDITINWISGGFLANAEPHYDAAQNEFVIPAQLLAGKTNIIQVNWSGSGFRNANSIPADVFKWQFTTRPLTTKLDAPSPRVVEVSPRPGDTMPVLTMLELTFDQPMTLDRGLPYLRRTGGAFLPGIISCIHCDSSGRRLTIPLLMPPDNETKLTLEGFYSADGAASGPVIVRCEIGTNNYSSAQLNDISVSAKDARLTQLLSSMQTARARLASGTETVTWISLSETKDSLRGITVYPATFKWQGTNQFYEDISDIMGGKAFILGTDGKSCWMYSDDEYNGRRFDSNPIESVADMYGSVADPFNLAHNSVQSAISKGKLIYDGQAQLDGRACYCVKSWLVEQTGNDYFPADASRCEWWINSESYLPVQVVRDGPGYRQVYKFHYEGLNQPLPITAFQPPDTEGARPVEWHHLGIDETRFFTIKDGSDGQMSGRSGKRGPNNSSTSSGLN